VIPKLENYDLLSPEPIYIDGIGYFQSPTLRKISKLTFHKYNIFINLVSMDKDRCLEIMELKQEFDSSPEDVKDRITVFDLVLSKDYMINLFLQIFSFFIVNEIQFDKNKKMFYVIDENKQLIGSIQRDNFSTVCNLILKINYMATGNIEKKYKNKKAKELCELIDKAKKELGKKAENNNDMELSNIISKLSVQHNSLNIYNIWDITVYQLYDQFIAQNYKNQNDIRSMNFANWGGDYNPQDWYKTLKNL
jgi:hypothetical protein